VSDFNCELLRCRIEFSFQFQMKRILFLLVNELPNRGRDQPVPIQTTGKINRRGKSMQKSLHIDPGKCTGCKQCEMACSYEQEGQFNLSKSRIKVFEFHNDGRFVPYTCTQCADAWCQTACPTGAIAVNADTGAKEVAASTCVGCKVCTIACPFGTINYAVDTGKVVKCDLCGGDPACAKACPTDAITFVDAESTGFDKMRAWASKTDAGAQAEA
jgi:Fe-S-cluster-containing hydrogenase component 2